MTPNTGLQARAAGGDAAAFGELIRAWDGDLRGVAWSVVRSATETDDIMQATYEKAFRSISAFRGKASMKTWLHSICYRTAIDHARSQSRRQHESDEILERRAGTDSTSETALWRAELGEVLENLNVEQRSLLMLTAGLGYSFEEAGQITGLPRGTVASKVARARKALRPAKARPEEDE